MNNTGTLLLFELKKIFSKKLVWIALFSGILLVFALTLTNLSADGKWNYVKEQEKILSQLNGEKIDDKFISDFHNAIEKEIKEHPERYEKIKAYDPGAVYMNAARAAGKMALYDFFDDVMRDRALMPTFTAEDFYEKMRANIIDDSGELGSSGEETEHWLESFDKIEKPIKYGYEQGIINLVSIIIFIGWIVFLNNTVAVSGTFADEKTSKTDALILSSRNGRMSVCVAKLLAGWVTTVIQNVVFFGFSILISVVMFGKPELSAPVQNVIPGSPWNITVGQMMLIFFALSLVSGILNATTNMFFSYFTKSSVATVAIHTVILFAGLFNIPSSIGIVKKLWELKHTTILYYGTFCNTFMYGSLNNIAVAFIACSALTVIAGGVIMLAYRKSQVESR